MCMYNDDNELDKVCVCVCVKHELFGTYLAYTGLIQAFCCKTKQNTNEDKQGLQKPDNNVVVFIA